MAVWHGALSICVCGAGDVGDTPLLLLEGVLDVCNAAQLAQIQDDTLAGGRDIAADLCQHWKRCVAQEFGLPPPYHPACLWHLLWICCLTCMRMQFRWPCPRTEEE